MRPHYQISKKWSIEFRRKQAKGLCGKQSWACAPGGTLTGEAKGRGKGDAAL
jgi:hypothetical protein